MLVGTLVTKGYLNSLRDSPEQAMPHTTIDIPQVRKDLSLLSPFQTSGIA